MPDVPFQAYDDRPHGLPPVGRNAPRVLFGERFGRWRIAATVLVAAGVVLITL